MYHDVEGGAEFFFDENDYISADEYGLKSRLVHTELTTTSLSTPSRSRTKSDAFSPRGKKRLRRAVATIRSYAVPDSDDDMFDDDSFEYSSQMMHEKKRKIEESSLQKWVKHLSNLLKEEHRKVH
jgi:hypothetical protein